MACCAAARSEPVDIGFDKAIERSIARFPMLAGQTYLTMDMNRDAVNWTQDAAELYLLHEVLAKPELPHHAEVVQAWKQNRAQMAHDLGGAGSAEDVALGDYLAGMATMNSRNNGPLERVFTFIGVFGGTKGLTYNKDKYRQLDALLAFNADPRLPGDFDGDGFPNDREYWAARRYAEKKYPDLNHDKQPDAPFWQDDLDDDGLCVFIDIDSDGDGLSDGYESDVNGDGILDYLTPAKDTWFTPPPPADDDVFVNPDNDEYENMLDTDSDGDGKPDREEGVTDSDRDGIPDFLDAVDGPNPPRTAAPEAETTDVRLEKDVVYATVDRVALKLDLARPLTGAGPFPLIVCIHGGGWQLGDKSGHAHTIQEFAKRGYVAASVNYRLAPKYKFPAQIEDCKAAVRYLRAHAKEYQTDPQKVGAMGESAGGYLALMLGLLDPKDGLEGGGDYMDQSSKVQAVVNYYGGANLQTWKLSPEGEALIQHDFGKSINQVVEDYLGTSDRKHPIMLKASPANYADRNDPPVLSFHGTADLHVPIEEEKQFHKALLAAGVSSQLEIIEGAAHGWSGELMGRTTRMTFEFFDKQLKEPRFAGKAEELPTDVYSERKSSVPIQEDIVYGEVDGMKLHLDLARPPEGVGPFPLIVCFHGGTYEPNARKNFHREIQDFAEHGYVAATIEYRGILKGKYPYDPIRDAKTAVKFLRVNAAQYGIDPGHVGVWGHSMGGWVALMLGFTRPEDGFEPSTYPERSSAVQAVVDRYGPSDYSILKESGMTPEIQAFMQVSVGTTDLNDPVIAKSSPVTYVTPNAPPVLMLHNPADTACPIVHSERLLSLLQKAGVPATLERMRGSWHASELNVRTRADLEDRKRCRELELEFFDKYLKGKN